jgi:hypothetical protein
MSVSQATFMSYAVWGSAGAALAEVLELYAARRRDLQFNFVRACIVVIASAGMTGLYFTIIDTSGVREITLVQYGVFLALTIEGIVRFVSSLPDAQSGSELRPGFNAESVVAGGGAVLILHGWLQISSVGCFGALLAEMTRIRLGRKKLADHQVVDWLWIVIVVVTSGVVVLLHGVEQMNALTAMQLGAAGPLVSGRLRR